jgi:hypothetical protein
MKYFSISTHISVRAPNHKLYKKKLKMLFYFAPCIAIIYTSTYAHKPHLDLKRHADFTTLVKGPNALAFSLKRNP